MKIHFHDSCFDGVTSAAIAAWLWKRATGREPDAYVPVDYDRRATWLQTRLDSSDCVVDFLYHPDAHWWWDHHATSFLAPEARAHYQRRHSAHCYWDVDAPSCAGLVLRVAAGGAPQHLSEAAAWADKIDSARYESPEEAVIRPSPARSLSLSLAVDRSAGYQRTLIEGLRDLGIAGVVARPSVRDRCDEAERRYARGIDALRKNAVCDSGVVSYDLQTDPGTLVDGMMPYFLYPHANYAVGVTRSAERIKVGGNANPWRRPAGVHLGELFARFGGGGHQDVGAALFPPDGGAAAAAAATVRSLLRGRTASPTGAEVS